LEEALKAALSAPCNPNIFPVNGAQVIAERLAMGLLQ
jgi:hypothetical protein